MSAPAIAQILRELLRRSLRSGLLAIAMWMGTGAPPAWAVSRTCGADAIANTANVLCASPSGPCTGTSVTMSANIEVTAGGCDFDLGNRSLTIDKTFQMTGLGFVVIRNATTILMTATGKIKARGDFVKPNGYPIQGGTVSLASAGATSVSGLIDVSGDSAGKITITAGGAVTLAAGSLIQGNGLTTTALNGFSEGARIAITSTSQAVVVGDKISATGTSDARGGSIRLVAARSVTVDGTLDANGGEYDGGDVTVVAGDNITITKAVTVDSTGGGGWGGAIDLRAGLDGIGGLVTGGGVTVTSVDLRLNGSTSGGSSGDGGELTIRASGPIEFTGVGVGIHASAGVGGDGDGGSIFVNSNGNGDVRSIGVLDGDLRIDGVVVAQSGGNGGAGGVVDLDAGRNLTLNAVTTITGEDDGGDFLGLAGGTMTVNGAVNAAATHSTGAGGVVDMASGWAQNAGLTITKDITVTSGVSSDAPFGVRWIFLSGCALTVANNVKLDARGGPSAGALIQLIARQPMQLNANTQFLTGPGGSIETIHPPGQNPVIGSGVVFAPAREDFPTTLFGYQPCGQ